MERKECFGTIQEIIRPDGFATVETKPECRDCAEMMECLRQGKRAMKEKDERDELKKQELIAKIIDLSPVLTNEVGSCVLEFLNRIYKSPLGLILFKNLLLFFEAPQKGSSLSLTVPISSSTLDLIQGRDDEAEDLSDLPEASGRERSRNGFTLRILLIRKYFPGNRKANMGLIAREVIHMFSSDKDGTDQICQTLTPSESKAFRGMNTDSRVKWLMQKWGFQEEMMAVEKEIRE